MIKGEIQIAFPQKINQIFHLRHPQSPHKSLTPLQLPHPFVHLLPSSWGTLEHRNAVGLSIVVVAAAVEYEGVVLASMEVAKNRCH